VPKDPPVNLGSTFEVSVLHPFFAARFDHVTTVAAVEVFRFGKSKAPATKVL